MSVDRASRIERVRAKLLLRQLNRGGKNGSPLQGEALKEWNVRASTLLTFIAARHLVRKESR